MNYNRDTSSDLSLWWPIKFYCDSIYCPFERANQSKIGSKSMVRIGKDEKTELEICFYDVLIAPDKHHCEYATFASVFAALEFPSLIWFWFGFGLVDAAVCLFMSQFDSIFVKDEHPTAFFICLQQIEIRLIMSSIWFRKGTFTQPPYILFGVVRNGLQRFVRHSHFIFDTQ